MEAASSTCGVSGGGGRVGGGDVGSGVVGGGGSVVDVAVVGGSVVVVEGASKVVGGAFGAVVRGGNVVLVPPGSPSTSAGVEVGAASSTTLSPVRPQETSINADNTASNKGRTAGRCTRGMLQASRGTGQVDVLIGCEEARGAAPLRGPVQPRDGDGALRPSRRAEPQPYGAERVTREVSQYVWP